MSLIDILKKLGIIKIGGGKGKDFNSVDGEFYGTSEKKKAEEESEEQKK